MAEKGKRILVVDDANLVRVYYRSALEAAGYEVDEAMNGIEALERLLSAPFDLVVLDVNMPQMDGLTLLRTLRKRSGREAAVPVLVTSTEAKPQDMAAAHAAGANFYLVKPVSQASLVEHVQMLCGVA